MMQIQFYSVIFTFTTIFTIDCEWIEITPIENKRLPNTIYLDATTTELYENILSTPFTKAQITTAPSVSNEESPVRGTVFEDQQEEKVVTELPEANITNKDSLYSDDDYVDFQEKGSNGIKEFLPFLKIIQDKLLQFKKLHKSKMSVLKHLRDHMLINIKNTFTNLWKPKSIAEARGYEEDGHMDFPSNEGALMTIGFLTFAVFLIKLVIKLIHALKSKQQNYGIISTTTAASVVFLKRKKRDEEEEEMNRILQYIEEF